MLAQFKHSKTSTLIFFVVTILVVLVIVAVVYYPSLFNDFVNWDDYEYVIDNDLIKSLSLQNFPSLFKEPVSSNFHPLTMVSLAIDYRFFNINPFYYHLHNLLIHLLNTILVFFMGYLLSNRNLFVAGFTALIFGIHPMHVESVAWISERKDVLYTFFFVFGLNLYIGIKKSNDLTKYILVFILFIFSTLAKSAAVVFPLILLLLDYYIHGRVKRKDIIWKIPFFIVSIFIGIIAIRTQSEALDENIVFSNRIIFASYGFVTYLIKFFIPYGLNNLILTPKQPADYFFIYLLFALIILITASYKIFKRSDNLFSFGVFFYLISIILVLQFITVGNALISERYTYVPYIGIAFAVSMVIKKFLTKFNDNKITKYITYTILILFLSFNSVLAFNRTKVWKDGESLWEDALRKNPENYRAHNSLGNFYFKKDMLEEAFSSYSNSIIANKQFKHPYYNRSYIYFINKDYESALIDINKCLEIDKNFENALILKQKCLVALNKPDQALANLDQLNTIRKNPSSLYNEKGRIFYSQGEYIEALSNFKTADSLTLTFDSQINSNIGLCLLGLKRFDESIQYFNKVIQKDSAYLIAYMGRGKAYFEMNSLEMALKDFSKSIQLNPNQLDAYKLRAYIYSTMQNYILGFKDYSSIINLDNNNAEAYYNRSVASFYLKDYNQALVDAKQAKDLGYNVPDSYLNRIRNSTEK